MLADVDKLCTRVERNKQTQRRHWIYIFIDNEDVMQHRENKGLHCDRSCTFSKGDSSCGFIDASHSSSSIEPSR